MSSFKYVIVQRTLMGRFQALRGLSFETEAEAKAHIVASYVERFRDRFHVEKRTVKSEAEIGRRMTCQCCGRDILANLGTIALHGYERPGHGWQTGSCMGAKALPFEVSRDRLGEMIRRWRSHKAALENNRVETAAETVPVRLQLEDRSAERRHGRYPSKWVDVTRETFTAVKAENDGQFRQRGYHDFDRVKAVLLQDQARGIREISDAIVEQQARFDGWKQTDRWDATAKAWVAL